MKKKNILNIIFYLLIIVSFGYLYFQNKKLVEKVSLLEINKKINPVVKDIYNGERYSAEILQLGGEGSHLTQITVYQLDEQSVRPIVLNPPEEFIKTSFNVSRTMMTVKCTNNYKIAKCILNSKDVDLYGLDFCDIGIEENYKNIIKVECEKNK